MSSDGLPAPARFGITAANTDRSTAGARPPRSTHLSGRLAELAALAATAAFLFAACGSSATPAPTTAATTAGSSPESSVASPEASPSASAAARLVVPIVAVNNSKVTGGAVLSDLGDGSTAVTVGVIAIGFKDPLPAEIVSGSCADMASAAPSSGPSAGASAAASMAPSAAPSAAGSASASGSPEPSASVNPNGPFPLKDITGGSSNTIVPVPLSTLTAQPFSIVIHKSASDPTIQACADITTAGVAIPSGLGSAAPSLPSSSAAPSAS
ncbi:MAG TPA: hypothetical protein VHS36_04200 [Candidatus Limnocylindrales bacterium]|nr:hypothetical protein [Candidatus Limnocylindrales bacterium]